MRRTLAIAMAALGILSSAFAADKSKNAAPPAPLPPAISAAKTAFLSNGCEQQYLTCAYVYNELYSGINTQGHFRLVAAPADADVVIEIGYVTRSSHTRVVNGDGGSTDFSRIVLRIIDRPTHYILWTVSEYSDHKGGVVPALLADLEIVTKPNATAGPTECVAGFSAKNCTKKAIKE